MNGHPGFLTVSVRVTAQWVRVSGVCSFQCADLQTWSELNWPNREGVSLGGLLALGARDSFDGAESSVEPGFLGGLDLVQGQTQVMLQVL